MFSRPSRRAERQAAGSTKPRRRLSYANVTATLALVLVLGAGAAYAKNHFIITKISQIKGSVVSQLKTPGLSGAAGPAGPAGAAGLQGPVGATGGVGPQGPGADTLVTTIAPGSVSSAVGAIPVQMDCEAGPTAVLQTTATSGGTFPFVHGGSYHANFIDGPTSSSANDTSIVQFQDDGSLPATSPTDLGPAPATDTKTEDGTILLQTYSGDVLFESQNTETVTFALSVSATDCSIDAQIVPS